jgi:uncharacterized protein
MKLQQQFTINHPIDSVWTFFHDLPKVAACMPGAEYFGENESGMQAGRVSVKVGPFQSNFEGQARVNFDERANIITMDGQGVDRKGASRGKMTMACALQPEGSETSVTVDSEIQLSGTIAQFGRTNIIPEISNVLVKEFVKNVNTAITSNNDASDQPSTNSTAKPAAASINGLSLLIISFKNWSRSLFTRRA